MKVCQYNQVVTILCHVKTNMFQYKIKYLCIFASKLTWFIPQPKYKTIRNDENVTFWRQIRVISLNYFGTTYFSCSPYGIEYDYIPLNFAVFVVSGKRSFLKHMTFDFMFRFYCKNEFYLRIAQYSHYACSFSLELILLNCF